MQIKIINGRDVEQILPMAKCIALMRDAMRLEADGKAVQPVRTRLEIPHSRNLLTMMPGVTANPDTLGIKVVTVFPGNFGTELGSHQGMVLLFDPASGAPIGIVDGRAVTAIRTAAATAVATDVLAASHARTLAVLGYGDQARSHLEALCHTRSYDQILLWGRDANKAAAFAEEMTGVLSLSIELVTDVRAACEADIVTAVTAAANPVIEGRWLREGMHINLVGSSIPATAEIDDEGVRLARLFGDSIQGVTELGGEYRRALASSTIQRDHLLGTIGEVMAGKVSGRERDTDITIFKSLGMASEDLVSCHFLIDEAGRRNLGQTIEW